MISVIIPTYNRSALLRETLASITEQTLPSEKFEILVVDNGSKDNTAEVVSSFETSFKKIKYLQEPAPGLHSGRHRGMLEAAGEILVFADDDIIAFPTWLEGVYESFQRPDVGLVGGKNIPLYEVTPPTWVDELWEATENGRYLTYYSLLDFGDELKEVHPYFVFGCNFSIRKNILEKIKGFHPDGMPENFLKYRGDGETYVAEQIKRQGYITLYNPKASVHHRVTAARLSQQYIYKRAYAEGITKSYSDTRKNFLEKESPARILSMLRSLKSSVMNLMKSDMQKKINKSFKQGYHYHQTELQKDKALRDWVMKDNYLTD